METDFWKDHDREWYILGMHHISGPAKNARDEYILEKMKIQPEIMDLLRCLKWSMIPDALKCYALGDIKFLIYNL